MYENKFSETSDVNAIGADDVLTVAPAKSRVAIVGRPNVGKSTLFNILTETRKALVKDQPGVTRDILIESGELWGKHFDVVDTGGITESPDWLSQLVREQVIEFLASVDLIILVMDGRAGLVPEDREVLRIVKRTGLPFALVVNKIDRPHEADMLLAEFHEFGVTVIPTSFEQRQGLAPMLEWLHSNLPEEKEEQKEKALHIAFLGKPNAGKSSLINRILGEYRVLVSEVPGTTLDAVDIPAKINGREYMVVDTAGLRKGSKRTEELEVISAFKSQMALRKSHIILLVIDGVIGPTEQDARILELITENHKGVIVVANKSDLGRTEVEEYRKTFKEQIDRVFHFFTYLPVVFTRAKTGYGMGELINEIEKVSEKMNFRVSTSELNDFFFSAIRGAPAPVFGVNNVKFYYVTQTYQKPPAFIAFANHPDGVDNAYRRFLVKCIKEKFDLWGIPVRIFVMKSRAAQQRN